MIWDLRCFGSKSKMFRVEEDLGLRKITSCVYLYLVLPDLHW